MKVYPQKVPKNDLRGLRNRNNWIKQSHLKAKSSNDGPLSLLATSLRHQTTEFFNNSTLHGVRYIAEKERPFCEKWVKV